MLPRKFLSSLLVQTTLLSLWASTWSASFSSSKYISTTATITSNEPLTTTTTITEYEGSTASPTAAFSQATTLLEADTKSASTEAEAQNATKIIPAPVNPLHCYNTSKAALFGMLEISNTSNVAVCPSNSKCISLEAKGLPMLGFFKVDVTLGRCVPAESCRSDLCTIMIDQIYNTTVDSCVASCCDYNLCNAVSQQTENRDQQSLMTEPDTESVSTETETEITTETSPDSVSSSKSVNSTVTITTNETLMTSPQTVTTESEVPTAPPTVTIFQARTLLTKAQRQYVSTKAETENATEILPGEPDPCVNNACDINAKCVVDKDSRTGYDCICNENEAYYGNGFFCYHNCWRKCNTYATICPISRTDSGDITVTCKCMEGYIGDGSWCIKDPCVLWEECFEAGTCVGHRKADGRKECRCKNETLSVTGGCKMDPCDNACSPFASCIQNDVGAYRCQCRDEYRGDGYTCSLDHLCDNACSPDADCTYILVGYKCRCREGFRGDGGTCSPDPCYKKICPPHSVCQYNQSSGTVGCFCDADGRLAVGEPCKEISCRTRRCPSNAYCFDSHIMRRPGCNCRRGYCPVDEQCIEKEKLDGFEQRWFCGPAFLHYIEE